MDKLKLVLKKAIESSASEVLLEEEKEGEMTLANGAKTKLVEFGKLEKKWLEELHGSFFAKNLDSLRKGEPLRGQLNIVKVGIVYLVAKSNSPKSLTLFFPPTGEVQSQAFLARLLSSASQVSGSAVKTETKSSQPSPSDQNMFAANTQVFSNPQEPVLKEKQAVHAGLNTTFSEHATAHVLDQAVLDNADKLALVISTNPSVLAQAHSTFEELKLFTYKLDQAELFESINDRMVPKCIIIDEEVPCFQKVLKRIYDMGIEKRLLTTVLMLSKTHRSDNMKLAFSFSVDLIVNIAELKNLSALLAKSHASRQSGIQTWLDLQTNKQR